MTLVNEPMDLVDSMAMDCDETVDLDMPTVDQAMVGSSPAYCQLRSGRRIYRKSGKEASQKPRVDSKPKRSSRGVRKRKKRVQRQATTAADGKRQQRMQDTIANSSALFNEAQHDGGAISTALNLPEQAPQLTEELVLQALFSQTPGLTFPSHAESSFFSTEEVSDLVKALEDYRVTLTRMGNAIESPDVGKLLKAFAHDVLSLLSQTKQSCGRSTCSDELWDRMSHSFKSKGSKGWLRGTVMTKLVDICGVDEARKLRRHRAFNHAMFSPGRYQPLDLAIRYARQQLGEPHYGHISTLRSLVSHFEAARTRYLSSINHAARAAPHAQIDIDMAGFGGETKLLQPFGTHPRRRDTDSSSSEEYDSQGDSGAEADVEDNVQVEGELLQGRDRALIRVLDLWMELSTQDERQESVDFDMLSALDLGSGQ